MSEIESSHDRMLRLEAVLKAVSKRLEQCFEPTVPLMTIKSELDGAVKDAYLIIRRANV